MYRTRFITIPILVLLSTSIINAQSSTEPSDKYVAKAIETTSSDTSSSAAQTVDPDKWQFRLSPYLWIAGISGRAGLGNLTVDVESGLTDDNVNLNFGFMATFEARKKRFIILTDLQYSNLGTDRPTPGPLFSSATADFKTFILDPEVGYRIYDNPERGDFLGVVGGIRYWHVRADLTFNPGFLTAVSASRGRGWVDAVGGFRGGVRLSKRMFFTGKADLGGGGSQFTYQLFGGVGFQLTKRFSLTGGYRDLKVDYDKDGFLFDVALHGPVFGMGIKF
jgi:hypothetical protein